MRIRASRVAACTMTVTLAVSALAAAGGSATAAPGTPDAPTAAEAPDRLQGDFNGDGYRDVATTAPQATAGGKQRAGQIAVAYGSAGGLKPKKQAISQHSPGVPGKAETGDGFGLTVHTGDFNGDGYADLAVGAEGEDVARSGGTDKDGGAVQILWGSPTGLSKGTDVPDPAPGAHDKFGQSLAAGDFDADGTTDLAIGSTGAKVWIYQGALTTSGGNGGVSSFTAPIWADGAGAFALTSGDVNHDGTADLLVNGLDEKDDDNNSNFLFMGSPSGPATSNPVKLPGGLATAIADFDGDSYGDIAIGNHWEPGNSGIPGSVEGGKVTIRYGGASGVDTTRPAQHLDQRTPGVPGSSEPGDGFGQSLSAGDINGDGKAELLVGTPQEGVGNDGWAVGTVTVLNGSAQGVTGEGATSYHQNSAGIPGKGEPFDRFGSAVLVSDTNGDGYGDLAVGGAGENDERGALWSVRGSASGPSASRAASFGPRAFGVSTAPGSQLGTGLTG